ncbi:MAG: hypothetical protein U1E51_23215, partial [Candidatus Binatia bacterium]|nr:hypothetical protein [Candidatus Binatia bacterium]
ELAPILEALADEIVEMATASDDLGARMSAGFEGIGAEIATVIDLVNLLTAAWKGLKGFMLFFGATEVKVLSLIGSAIQGVHNLIPGMEVEFADTMHRMADEMMQMSADAFGESGKAFGTFWSDENSNKVEKFFDDMKAKSAEAAASMALDSFFRGVESGPMVDLEAADAIDKIDASLESFFDFADEIAREAADMARTAAENLEQEVASIFDATRSPMEQYEARITRLNELLQLGPENGGLAWDTYGRAVRKAREELEATANFEVKSPAALERGSVAEFSARQQIIRDNQSDALKREFMKGLDEEKKQTSFLKQIESNLRQTDAVVTVSIP